MSSVCAKLLFTETDNLVYETKTDDVYKDFHRDEDLFDFSSYPTNSGFNGSIN